MEDLIAKKELLETKHQELEEESIKVRDELSEVNKAICHLKIAEMTNEYKEFLVKRLSLLKMYVDNALKVYEWVRLAYKIKKLERPRVNDWHEPISDYLPWKIMDRECLDEIFYIDVVIDVYAPHVEDFVVEWMSTNIPRMRNDELFERHS